MDDEAWVRQAEANIQKDPGLWAYFLQIRNPGLPLIDSLPQPGDVIRDNEGPCEVMVKRVTQNGDSVNFDCRVIHGGEVTHHKCYYNGYRLANGRLLQRLKYQPGCSGFNLYSLGQTELFILRRARGQLDLFAF